MQLTKQQRVFLVTAWMRSKSYQVVFQEFSENFPERNVPNKTTTIWKNAKKYREEGILMCLFNKTVNEFNSIIRNNFSLFCC